MSKQWFRLGVCQQLRVPVGGSFCRRCIYFTGSVSIGEDLMFGCCHPSMQEQKPPVEVPTGLSILGDVEA